MTIINELPPKWEKESVLNLVDLINGYAFKPSDWSKEGLPIIRIQNLNDANASFNFFSGTLPEKFLVKPGELLFAWSGTPGTSFGAHIWRGGEAWLNQHIFKVRFDEQDLDKQFLCFAINRNLDRYITAAHGGAGLAHITKGKFESSEVLIPPLAEQRRIVAEIEKQFARLEECTAALRRVAEDLKQYRASVLKAACEGRLVPTEAELARAESRDYEPASALLERILAERRTRWEADQLARMKAQGKAPKDDKWKERYEESEEPATGHLPELPKGWIWVTPGQLGDVQLGRQRSPKNRSKDYPTKYIRAANITERGFDLSDILEMEFEPEERDRYRLRYGDIVLSEASGSPKQVGKPAVWQDELQDCCFQNTVIRLRPVGIGYEFLLQVFRHYYFNNVFARIAGGVGINHLGADKFSSIEIALPPLPEQHRIVAEVERRLHIVGELEELVRVNLERADELRRSILKRAFEGRLVRQDPSDEPAAELLERIAAERQRHTEEAMTQKKMPSDKRRKKSPETEPVMPLFAKAQGAAQPRELLTAFTTKEELTVEDLFRHVGYSFDSERDIDLFFGKLSEELESARLMLERTGNDDVVIKKGAA